MIQYILVQIEWNWKLVQQKILMNLKVVLISTFFVFLVLSQRCPDNCQTCISPTNCTLCRAGFFLASKTQCKPCPQECKTCAIGKNGGPSCSLCNDGFQLSKTNQCLACIPGCSKCEQSPEKCTACSKGYKLLSTATTAKVNTTATATITANTTNTSVVANTSTAAVTTTIQCIQDPSVCKQIKNCYTCTGKTKQQVCGSCSDRYYNFRRGCQRCRTPCLSCNLDLQSLWNNQTLPFWNETLASLKSKIASTQPKRRLLTQEKAYTEKYANWTLADWNASSWTSKLLKNFSEMSINDVKGWTEAYFFFKAAETQLAKTDTLVNLIFNCLPIFQELLNFTYDSQDQWKHLARYLSKFSSKKWNAPNLNDKIAEISSSRTVCTSCLSGYGFYKTNGSCIKCPQNCINCVEPEACTVCRPGFIISGKGCVRCHPTCLQCSKTTTNCIACNLPLSPVNGLCVRCHPSCKTCSSAMSASACLTCSSQYSLYPYQNQCFKCEDPQCRQCDAVNRQKCLTCKDGSALIGDKCIDCPNGCKSCYSFNSSVLCYECKPSYALLNNNTCSKCPNGCQKCSSTNTLVCLMCENGLYFDFKTRQCKRCLDGCSKCTNGQQCTEEKDGVVVVQGKLVKCPPGCTKCDINKPSTCLTCQPKYYLDVTECKRCKDGCTQCTKIGCLACTYGNNLVNGLCVRCSPECATCNQNNITQCLTCKKGLQLSQEGSCVKSTSICREGCATCNSIFTGECLECASGFALKEDKTCTKCLRGCNGRCNPKNITQCLSCMDGFALMKNVCSACPIGCSLCADGPCTKCLQGFKLDPNGSICKIACQFPCSTCNMSPCDACQAGYIKQGNKCVANVTCNPECGNCPIGTYQKSDTLQCVRCSSNCAICALGVCSSCFEGYYLTNKSLCQPCKSPCRTCYDISNCKMCLDGYIKEVITTGASLSQIVYGDKCVQCDDNCQTCAILSDRCTSCKMGFRLKGQKCIKLYAVKFMYRLNTDYKTFLRNGTSDSVLSSISNRVNISSQKTAILNMTEGSTIIEGSIEVQNQTEAATVQNLLFVGGGYNNTLLDNSLLNSSFSITLDDSIVIQPEVLPLPIFNVFTNSSNQSSNTPTTNSSSNTPTTNSSSNISTTNSSLNTSTTNSTNSSSNSSKLAKNSTDTNTSTTSTTSKISTQLTRWKQRLINEYKDHQPVCILIIVFLIAIIVIVIVCCCSKCKDAQTKNQNQQVQRYEVANTERYGETTNTNHMLQIPQENAENQESQTPSQKQPQEKVQSQAHSQAQLQSKSQLKSGSMIQSKVGVKKVQFADQPQQVFQQHKEEDQEDENKVDESNKEQSEEVDKAQQQEQGSGLKQKPEEEEEGEKEGDEEADEEADEKEEPNNEEIPQPEEEEQDKTESNIENQQPVQQQLHEDG